MSKPGFQLVTTLPPGRETQEFLSAMPLRSMLVRTLFTKYKGDLGLLSFRLNAYNPVANRIAKKVALRLSKEQERKCKDNETHA